MGLTTIPSLDLGFRVFHGARSGRLHAGRLRRAHQCQIARSANPNFPSLTDELYDQFISRS